MKAIREDMLEWVREKSGFDTEDFFFKIQTFRASRDLSEEHDEKDAAHAGILYSAFEKFSRR